MRVILFGGAGYLGSNLAATLADEGHDVEVIDKNPLPFKPKFGITQSGCMAELRGKKADWFVHLACPRNSTPHFNWPDAEEALDEGLGITRRLNCEDHLFISSMSVHDNPDNEYAQFKRMAERVVREREWDVVRLPTLLGLGDADVYRSDLGLHKCAAAYSRRPSEAWVNSRIWRHVMWCRDVVQRLIDYLDSPPVGSGGVTEISRGVVRYDDITPFAVRGHDPCDGRSYCAGDDAAQVSRLYTDTLRDAWLRLVERIRMGKAVAV